MTANVFAGLESFLQANTHNQIDQMYLILDTNRDGKITKYELQLAARQQGQILSDAQVDPFITEVDTNYDGGISKVELVAFLESAAKWTNLAFRYIDSNRDGYINLYELQNYINANTSYNDRPSSSDVKRFFNQLDFNRDGLISWSELYALMQQLLQNSNL